MAPELKCLSNPSGSQSSGPRLVPRSLLVFPAIDAALAWSGRARSSASEIDALRLHPRVNGPHRLREAVVSEQGLRTNDHSARDYPHAAEFDGRPLQQAGCASRGTRRATPAVMWISVAEPRRLGRLAAACALMLPVLQGASACSESSHPGHPTAGAGGGGAAGSGTPFESLSPGQPVPAGSNAGSSGRAGGGTAGSGGGLPSYTPQSLGSGIEQADKIQFEGTRLYSMSRHGALNVIDASEPQALRVLGRERPIDVTPFDLYVRDGFVLALYWRRGTFVYDAELEGWNGVPGESLLRVLDARSGEPTRVRELTIPGLVMASRLVDDTLYVASREGFPTFAAYPMHVTSFDVSTPDNPRRQAELNLSRGASGVKITDEHMYLATYDRDAMESSITRIDLARPSGTLAQGATIRFAGAVNADWQMDEYNGVLRVVGQPYSWNLGHPAFVRTFTVEASGDLVALGTVNLVSLRPAVITNVYFDGERGYAITALNTNPLLAFDLHDPSSPKQLATPWRGPILDLAPRGQRVLTLSFDPNAAGGSLSVSLHDATDLARPDPLSQVTFGGQWTRSDLDQKLVRTHFNVIDSDGAVLVPFAASKPDANSPTCMVQSSGVQVIEWRDDALTLHGLAGMSGEPQLAVLHDRQLYGFSDRQAAVFDLGDDGEAQRMSTVALEQRVDRTLAAGPDRLVRLAREPRTGATEVDVTTPTSAEIPGDAQLRLPPPPSGCPEDSQLFAALANQSVVYVVLRDSFDAASTIQYRVVTLDVSDAAVPQVQGNATLPFAPERALAKPEALVDTGSVVVGSGATLVFAERSLRETDAQSTAAMRYVLQVVDMSNPRAPSVSSIEVARGSGATSLLIDGGVVATSHYERAPSDDERVRFFMDRVDISNPRQPRSLPHINIPGSLLSLDAAAATAVTVDYEAGDEHYGSDTNCRDAYLYSHFDPATGACNAVVQRLRLIRFDARKANTVDSLELRSYEGIGATASTAGRVFARVTSRPRYSGASVCDGGCGDRLPNLLVLGGEEDGHWRTARLELRDGDITGVQPIAAQAERVALWSGFQGALYVMDATDAANPSLLRSIPTGIVIPLDVQCTADHAVAALGADGVLTVPLPP